MVRKKLGRGRRKRCRFCTKEGCPRPAFVDYKDVPTLKRLCNTKGNDDPSRKGKTMTADPKQDAPNGVRPREVRIVAHTMLFYWWPVWAVGLLLAGLTWLGGHCLAVVPAGTQVVENFDGDR